VGRGQNALQRHQARTEREERAEGGQQPEAEAAGKEMSKPLRAAVYGLAVGDALGVPYEFKPRGTFTVEGMDGYGTHNKPAGTWSDDTSLTLATCASIKALGRVDTGDIGARFREWQQSGAYSVDGVFDIGMTTATALYKGMGQEDEMSNGNGSLMRILPLAFTEATEADTRAVSAITHAHSISMDACVNYVAIARALASGSSISDAVDSAPGFGGANANASSLSEMGKEEVRSGGFVLDTLTAALWCLLGTRCYRDCVLEAVRLGGDTDTTAAVAGGLAGIVYGFGGIPPEWLSRLRGKGIIEACLF
jgi:ADP-ribosylglycohydrolase